MNVWQYGEQRCSNSGIKYTVKRNVLAARHASHLFRGIEWYLKTSKELASRKTLPLLACEQTPLLSEKVGERDVCESLSLIS